MKKLIPFFIALLLSYSASSQCVMQLSSDTSIKCGIQSILHLKLPWRTITSNVSTHLNDLYFTNNAVGYVVGANGVILKTINNGESFNVLNSGTTETLNSIFFKNSNSGFCVGNNGIILSTNNGGQTWNNVSIPGMNSHIKSIFFINESIGYFAGQNGCLFKTINGGANWFNIAPLNSSNDHYNAVHFADNNTGVVVGNSGKLLKTWNGGVDWNAPPTSITVDLTDVYFVNSSKCFAVGSSQIFTSNDGGTMWFSYTSYPTMYNDLYFQNDQIGFAVGYYGTIMKTTNGGETWNKEINCTTNEFNAVCARDSFFIAVGKNGSIEKFEVPQQITWTPNSSIDHSDPFNPIVYPFVSTNYKVSVLFDNMPDISDSVMVTIVPFDFSTINDTNLYCGNSFELSSETEWIPIYNNHVFHYSDLHFLNPDTGFVITEDGRILKTINGAYTWDSIARFSDALNSLDFVNSQIGYALGSSNNSPFCIKSVNGGSSWIQKPIVSPGSLYSIDFINANVGFACGGNMNISGSTGVILKTIDGGDNWDIKFLNSGFVLNFIYFLNDTIGFAVGTNGALLKTINSGENWSLIQTGVTEHLSAITFTKPNEGFIVGTNIILKTTNGGLNWNTSQMPYPWSYLTSVFFTDSLNGYITGTGNNNVQVFKTFNGGLTWTNHTINGLSYTPKALYFPTKKTGYVVGNYGIMAKLEIPDETWTPANYVYQNNQNRFFANPSQTASLSVSAVNRLGCIATEQVNFQVYPFYANYNHNYTLSCGSSVTLEMISNGYTGSTPLQIQWTPNIGISDTSLSSPVVSPIQSQLYHVNIATSNGCSFIDSIQVNITPLQIDAGNNETISCGEEAQLHVSSVWAPVATTYQQFNDIFFTSDQIGYGVSNGVYKTTNGGYTWEVKFQSDPLRKIFFVDSLCGYAIGSYGLIAKTVNGDYFTIPNYLYNAEPRDLHFIDRDTGYVICDLGRIKKTVNGCTDFITLVSGTTQNLKSVHFTSSSTGYVVGDNGTILKTTNYGQSWSTLSCGTTANLKTVYFLNDSVGFIVSEFHQSYKTIDGGNNWVLLPQLLPANAIHFVNNQVGYASGTLGATGAIAKTTNGGNNWTVTPYYGYSNFYGLTFPNQNVGYLFATGWPQNALLKIPEVPNQIIWTPSFGLNDTAIYNPIANPTQTTTYYVSTVAGYCPAQDSVVVNVIPFTINTIHHNNNQPNICKATIVIDSISTNYEGNGALQYQWTNSNNISNTNIQNPIITTNSSSWYNVTVTTPNNCVDQDSLYIQITPLMIDAGQDKYLYCGDMVQLDSIISNYNGPLNLTYLWSPTNGLSDSIVPNPYAIPTNLIYTVTVSLDTLCSAQDFVGVYFLTMDQPSICIVTVDASNKNVIVFEKPISNAIDSFYVYRETNMTGQYEKIGSIPYDSLSIFVDQTSAPSVNSNQYKISLIDTCGFQSNWSDSHKTMHLSINQGIGQTYNLIWQPYQGFQVTTYNIYRGTDPNQMQLIGTISGVNTQYTDLNPPAGYVYYQVEVVAPYFCTPSMRAGFNSSRSNIASNNTISVLNYEENGNFEIYPNPTQGMINLDSKIDTYDNLPFLIYNVLGELLLTGTVSQNIDVSTLINGVYLFQIEYNGHFYNKRFVVQK